MSQQNRALIVNLFAGPSAGKSTTAAGVFYELKKMGISCELVTEYAKSKVWEESFNTFNDQIYMFGKQHHRIFDPAKKVDVVITDGPILLSLIYGKNEPESFRQLVQDKYHQYNNLNFYLNRPGDYDPVGRLQNEEEAKAIDNEVLNMLNEYSFPYTNVQVDESTVKRIANVIMSNTLMSTLNRNGE